MGLFCARDMGGKSLSVEAIPVHGDLASDMVL